ncbi:MAG: lipopolysaccharide kinase InaA family protein, partial [Myroides sp.]
RDLVQNPDLENHEEILRAFTVFCYKLHEAGVEFKDHSPGNTLIKINSDNSYSFYLVDLNRMKFHTQMSFEQRMYNLRRLTPKKEMIAIMANEYAKLYTQKSEQEIFNLLWNLTSEFQMKFHRKQKLKKQIKFWKK